MIGALGVAFAGAVFIGYRNRERFPNTNELLVKGEKMKDSLRIKFKIIFLTYQVRQF